MIYEVLIEYYLLYCNYVSRNTDLISIDVADVSLNHFNHLLLVDIYDLFCKTLPVIYYIILTGPHCKPVFFLIVYPV